VSGTLYGDGDITVTLTHHPDGYNELAVNGERLGHNNTIAGLDAVLVNASAALQSVLALRPATEWTVATGDDGVSVATVRCTVIPELISTPEAIFAVNERTGRAVETLVHDTGMAVVVEDGGDDE
jgi:hypothetical protein